MSLGCICWYCHWGWSKPVADIYRAALADFDGCESPLDYGPGHIVWSDENFDDDSIDYCIKACDDVDFYSDSLSVEDLEKCRKWLQELRKIPEEIRCCEPDGYDGERPELFPPVLPVEKHDR